MAAPVVWFEIAGRDLDVLTRFYGDLLGWKIDADNPQRYGMVDTGAEGGIPGGIYAPGDPVGEYVSFYAAVQSLEAYLERSERLGGKVVQPPTPISDTARVAMLLDPEGHRIGHLEQADPVQAEGAHGAAQPAPAHQVPVLFGADESERLDVSRHGGLAVLVA